MGSTELFFFFLPSLPWGGGGGYTHILREVEGLYIVLDTVHSTPPPIHSPSFFHFHLNRHHTHAHIINYTLYSLFHPYTLFLSLVLAHFLYTLLFQIFSFFFSLFFIIIYTRVHVCRSHIQQHLNIVFSVIIKRNNDNI